MFTSNILTKYVRCVFLTLMHFIFNLLHFYFTFLYFQIIVMYLQVLGFEKHKSLMQYSWNFMNDSLRTDIFLRYQPETVACACIYLTARKLKLPLPKNPAWYTIFGATEVQIKDICVRILRLYNRPKVNVEALEKKVEELCKKYQEAKLKAKGGVNSGNNTPNNNSPSSPSSQKTSGAHNAWGGFISRSGSHIAPPVQEKKSRSRSPTSSPLLKHHRRSKKHARSRSRSSSRNHKKTGHKRRSSYSRSRSLSPPHKRKSDGRKKHRSSRSPSDDRYVYDKRENSKYEKRYEKEDKYKDYKEDKYREDKYKEDRYYEKTQENNKYKKSKYREQDEKDRERSKERTNSSRRR